MITIQCTTENCPQTGYEQFFLGQPEYVICGGCQAKLQAIATQPDPDPIPAKDYLPQ